MTKARSSVLARQAKAIAPHLTAVRELLGGAYDDGVDEGEVAALGELVGEARARLLVSLVACVHDNAIEALASAHEGAGRAKRGSSRGKRSVFVDGLWVGHFRYLGERRRVATRVLMTFSGGSFAGVGDDESGAFSVEGACDARRLSAWFIKRYEGGGEVRYAGAYDEAKGVLAGKWRIPDSDTSGYFALSPPRSRGRGAAREAREAKPDRPPKALVQHLMVRPVGEARDGDERVVVHVALSREYGTKGELARVEALDRAITAALARGRRGKPGDAGCGGGFYALEYVGRSRGRLLEVIEPLFEEARLPSGSYLD